MIFTAWNRHEYYPLNNSYAPESLFVWPVNSMLISLETNLMNDTGCVA